jgi:hypothetical protein
MQISEEGLAYQVMKMHNLIVKSVFIGRNCWEGEGFF